MRGISAGADSAVLQTGALEGTGAIPAEKQTWRVINVV